MKELNNQFPLSYIFCQVVASSDAVFCINDSHEPVGQ